MLSERLKQLRTENDLLQKDVADKINITTSAYGFYEQGKRTPDAETLQKLADFFNVSVDYLLGRTNEKNSMNIKESPEKRYGFATKAYHNLDVGGLSDEDIAKVEEYIELLKQKYNPDGTLKKKD
ncbi:helix-turn-helix domain-containing protein [Geosporobacter ferrireducens]|uniref:Transcriptional regulator n=1 Tax=Geosporobacter ferrireducens TaxID=1424294 RepID=A0A1D8GBT2_9FIRM|nr:helix-turn-helix domain-containing protein [Geosporobacter ferrireducens]AOT68372.1 transcriptional regulator [Geosporobacter ferrireducens]